MSLEWESHRVYTRAGNVRGNVYTLSRSTILRIRLSDAATTDTTFDSLAELEMVCRQKRWTLRRVSHLA